MSTVCPEDNDAGNINFKDRPLLSGLIGTSNNSLTLYAENNIIFEAESGIDFPRGLKGHPKRHRLSKERKRCRTHLFNGLQHGREDDVWLFCSESK